MARTVISKYSWLGMNYYHESMGQIERTDAQIEADLDKIQALTNKIKIYHNPLVDNDSIAVNICQRAKARGMYVVWVENNDTVELNDTTWASTYTPAVLSDATIAENSGADEFLIGNELSLHINSGADLMASASNYVAYVNAMKTLATSTKANFTRIVGIEEVWGQDYKWGNNDGIGTVDKIYFTVYETQAQFKTTLTNLLTYENLGTVAIGEFSTTDTMDSVAGTDEDKWATMIANRCKIIDDLDYTEAYPFTFRDTGTDDNGRGFGFFNTLSEDTYHTAWQVLFGERRWITSTTRTNVATRTAVSSTRIITDPDYLINYIKSLSGLVAYYPLNETTGSTADNAEGTAALDGTITGASINNSGRVGQAYSFDGVNDRVAMSRPTNAVDNFSMFVFFKSNAVTQNEGIIISNGTDAGGYAMVLGTGGNNSNFGGLISDVAWVDSGDDLVINTWYFLVMLRDNGTTKFYVNAVQSPNTATDIPKAVPDAFEIGHQSEQPSRYIKGKIQHVAIFNRVLTSSEMLRIAQLAGLV